MEENEKTEEQIAFEEWQSQGKERMEYLKGLKAGLVERLRDVNAEIEGFSKALCGAIPGQSRPKIRPALRELLNGSEMTVDELVTATAEKLDIEEEKVRDALNRWASQDAQVVLDKSHNTIRLSS